MKKLLRVLAIIVVVIIAGVIAGLGYFKSKFPVKIEVENIKVESTPERLQRGDYLVHHVVGCIDCHSDRDFSKFAGPIVAGTLGRGGFEFNNQLAGVPGSIYAANITPAGIGDYSDGELLRVITTGINKKGEALFPLMPYMHYGHGVACEDLYSIITYIRSLNPIENKIPERHLDFPMNLIVNTIPSPANIPDKIPAKSDTLAYGEYVINAVACFDCHTKLDHGKPLPGMEYAGGFEFHFPNGDLVTSANITPDVETGIGALNKQDFIAKFKAYDNEAARNIKVADHAKNTVMPWTALAGMTEEDLGAIYTYLRTVKPVHNSVITFRPGKVNL